MDKKHIINILYCIDETKKDYSRFLWISIYSLLENNKDEDIHIYVITTNLEYENKKELERIVNLFWKKIFFSKNTEIIPKKIVNQLPKNNWHISTYYRLFFYRCFPEINDKILYLDCDTIINNKLSNFYNTPFEGKSIIWQLDIPLTRYECHKRIWTEMNSYINVWVILINIPEYIKIDIIEGIKYVNKNYNIKYNDQDYLNILFNWKIWLYESLQSIVVSKFGNNIEKSLIIHTVAKPDYPFSQCPNKIIKIFDTYLKKTKWKDFYKNRKISFHNIKEYVYRYIKNFIVYKSEKLFWVSIAWKFYNFYLTTHIKRIMQNLRNYFN